MRRLATVLAVLMIAAGVVPAAGAKPGGTPARLRLNHVQAEGTHNSYHLAPDQPPANQVPEWQYSHDPIDTQLAGQGVRQLELDVHHRPSNPEGRRFLVHHVDGADERSTCPLLVECLEALRAWSDSVGRRHHTVVVHVEPKDGRDGNTVCTSGIDCFESMDPRNGPIAGHYGELDAEIRSVLGDRLVTPRVVQGSASTLRQAVTTTGWPTVDDARGTFLFVLLDGGHHRDGYRAAQPVDPVLFTEGKDPSNDPHAAVFRVDDPRGAGEERIRDLVSAGFLVRTRADTDRAFDAERFAAALESGAHLISTDVPRELDIPGGTPSRCSPVTAPPSCRSWAIESL